MTQPAGPILGSAHLDDGAYTKFRWNDESGLSSPAPRPMGSVQQTFDGPVRIVPQASAYMPKDITLSGYFLEVGGLAEGYHRIDDTYNLAGTAGTVSVLQMGLLGLHVIAEKPEPEQLRAHRRQMDYTMRAVAVPGTWTSLFGSYLGSEYGVVINAESSAYTTPYELVATARPLITNPGTAPTPLVLTISITGRTTRFFVRCTAPGYTKRISVTPETGGVAKITEAHGLFVPSGTSSLRYEEANGSIVTGTIASSLYGTRWRYSGLDETLSTAGPAIFYNSRRNPAYVATSAFTTSAGLVKVGADVPRFGNPGTYDENDAGLLVEPLRTNLVLQSQALASASWTVTGTVTRTANSSTAPDGTTTSTRLVYTAGVAGSVNQTSPTLTAARYVFSFYARGTGSFAVSVGTVITSQIVSPGTNWQRYQYLGTGTAATHVISFADNALAAGDVQIWGVQLELATGQSAAVASSYIPTTTTSISRFADQIVASNLQNLLAYSNSFHKQTLVSGTRGLWYLSGATITSATRQTGPTDVADAYTFTFGAGAQAIEQELINSENLRNGTVCFSIWVKNSTSTPSSNLQIRVTDGSVSSTATATNLTDEWQRLNVQMWQGTALGAITVSIRSAAAITVYAAHAHVHFIPDTTEGPLSADETDNAISNVYIETQDIPYASDKSWSWPDWLSQNGYIQADVCQVETGRPENSTRTYLGDTSGGYVTNTPYNVQRDSAANSSTNSVVFYRTQANNTLRSCSSSAVNMNDGAYHTLKIQWENYLTDGVRTGLMSLFIDGTLRSTQTLSGSTRWSNEGLFRLVGSNAQCFQTMKNIFIGSPALPAGSVPEPY